MSQLRPRYFEGWKTSANNKLRFTLSYGLPFALMFGIVTFYFELAEKVWRGLSFASATHIAEVFAFWFILGVLAQFARVFRGPDPFQPLTPNEARSWQRKSERGRKQFLARRVLTQALIWCAALAICLRVGGSPVISVAEAAGLLAISFLLTVLLLVPEADAKWRLEEERYLNSVIASDWQREEERYSKVEQSQNSQSGE